MIEIRCDECGYTYDILNITALEENCPKCGTEHYYEEYNDEILEDELVGFTFEEFDE